MRIRFGRIYAAILAVSIVAATGICWIEKSAMPLVSPDDVIVRDHQDRVYMDVQEAPFFTGGPIYLSDEPTYST